MSDVREIGRKLSEAGRLKLRPLCVYGSDSVPQGVVPSHLVDRCIARAVYACALHESTPPIYVEAGHEACCMGGRTWTGFSEPHPKLKYFVTTGTPDFRGGAAEHLKATPELFDEYYARAGKITPPGKYLVISPCDIDIPSGCIRSFIVFAGAEQVRNLCALAQYRSGDTFFRTLIPGGPTCATMITYAAGMAAAAPKYSAFIGPVDPTGNIWLPPELMIMSIPAALALQMAADADESFIGRRGRIAFPGRRVTVGPFDATSK